jgi:hypothetical protein
MCVTIPSHISPTSWFLPVRRSQAKTSSQLPTPASEKSEETARAIIPLLGHAFGVYLKLKEH